MKFFLVLVTLWVFVNTSPMKEYNGRRYIPSENDPFRFKYIPYEDAQGNIHFEDLNKLAPRSRARTVTVDDVNLYLYTRKNVDKAVPIRIDQLDELINSELYDPKNNNIFIIHGWNNDYKSIMNTIIKNAILKMNDTNVFVVDWGRIANKDYFTASGSVMTIGGYVANFISKLMNHYNISPSMFKLVGHSLGAHIAGCIGSNLKGSLDYIVGLDPAGPLFSLGNTENRLDETDAQFVEIVHTSGRFLGFGSSMGHVDYFPNDGTSQPGCGLDLIGTCAHSRAYYYFEESILHGGFVSTECNGYNFYKRGICDGNDNSFLGSINPDKRAYGDYYLDTRNTSPYSLS